MKRRSFVGGALAGVSISGAYAMPQKVKAGDIPAVPFGKTGVKVSVIAQGGARMDLHPDVQTAAAHVRCDRYRQDHQEDKLTLETHSAPPFRPSPRAAS
jgi:hypothetical protein